MTPAEKEVVKRDAVAAALARAWATSDWASDRYPSDFAAVPYTDEAAARSLWETYSRQPYWPRRPEH